MDWKLDLLTPLTTTSNYNATADLHTLQITTAPAKPFPAFCALTSRSLATTSNSGDSSASRVQNPLSQQSVQDSCQLPQLSTANSQLRNSTFSITRLAAISHQPPSLHTSTFNWGLNSLIYLAELNSRLSSKETLSVLISARLGSLLCSMGADPIENTFLTIPLLLLAYSLSRERVYRAIV
jgi:hypothetical protein